MPRLNKIKSKAKFKLLFEKGAYLKKDSLALRVLVLKDTKDTMDEKPCEWAVCVSSKTGKAHLRNRYKRICFAHIRNFYKQLETTQLPKGACIALLPQRRFCELPYPQRETIFKKLLYKI